MKGTVGLAKSIRKLIEEDCLNNVYLEKFSKEMQEEINTRSALIAKFTIQDEDFMTCLHDTIEESIRLMILTKTNTPQQPTA